MLDSDFNVIEGDENIQMTTNSLFSYMIACCPRLFKLHKHQHYHTTQHTHHYTYLNNGLPIHTKQKRDEEIVTPVKQTHPPTLDLSSTTQSMLFQDSNEDNEIQMIVPTYDGNKLIQIDPEHIHVEHYTKDKLVPLHSPKHKFKPKHVTFSITKEGVVKASKQ